MSLSAAVIRELVAAGLTGDALVSACERIEAAHEPREDRARRLNAERQARYRERNVSNVSNVTLLPPSNGSPTPPPITTPHLPDDDDTYRASARDFASAVDQVLPDMHPARTDLMAEPVCAGWIASGYDLHADVLPAIRAAVASATHRAKSYRGFTGWIERHHADRIAAQQARPPPVIVPLAPATIHQRPAHAARNTPKAALEILAERYQSGDLRDDGAALSAAGDLRQFSEQSPLEIAVSGRP